MPSTQSSIMEILYRYDIWEGFEADPNAQPQGWNGNHPSLGRLAALPGAKIVVDVGVWKGQSTISMALALKQSDIDGCVIAVDTFLGSFETWDMTDLYDRSNGMPNLYKTFMSNVRAAGVEGYIVPLPQTSLTAARILQARQIHPALIHIDAGHEYEEVKGDCEAYFDILAPGGYLVGDDYDAGWPGVNRAVDEFSVRTGRPLTVEVPKWILQK